MQTAVGKASSFKPACSDCEGRQPEAGQRTRASEYLWAARMICTPLRLPPRYVKSECSLRSRESIKPGAYGSHNTQCTSARSLIDPGLTLACYTTSTTPTPRLVERIIFQPLHAVLSLEEIALRKRSQRDWSDAAVYMTAASASNRARSTKHEAPPEPAFDAGRSNTTKTPSWPACAPVQIPSLHHSRRQRSLDQRPHPFP